MRVTGYSLQFWLRLGDEHVDDLGLSLARLAPRLTYVLLGVQVFLLFPLFALVDTLADSRANSFWGNGVDPGMAWLSLFSLVGLGVLGWKGYLPQERDRLPLERA